MGKRFKGKAALALLAIASTVPAWGRAPTDATVRVVDIGAGLCVVIAVPGGHGMLYDAGPRGGTRCVDAVRELVPGGRLNLVVLSHSDVDHIGMTMALLADLRDRRGRVVPRLYTADAVIHPGDVRPRARPRRGAVRSTPRPRPIDMERNAIAEQARLGARVFNLREMTQPASGGRQPLQIRLGDSFAIGAGRATFIAGWGNGRDIEGPGEGRLSGGPMHNALSIVIRFEYGGNSILLTGDTVGRMIGDPPGTCAYAERIMVSRAAAVPIRSDVLIGQHHGADNSASTCFIQAVRPGFVVFSAGAQHGHPTQAAVDRLTDPTLLQPVPLANIFRTDRGDNPGPREMTAGSGGCKDPAGDDDVEVRMPLTGRVTVDYTGSSRPCPP